MSVFWIFAVLVGMWASLVAQMVQNPPAMRETRAPSQGWEDPLEENMAAHSSILARRNDGQRSLAGCSLLGSQRVNMTEATEHSTGSMTGQVK